MNRKFQALAGALAVLTLANCAPDPNDDPDALAPPVETTVAPAPGETAPPVVTVAATGQTAKVTSLDNSFRVENLVVEAGTEVKWDNKGRNAHDIRPKDDPSTDSWGVLEDKFQPGDSYSFVFTTPGTYAYYCSIHGTAKVGMIGTVTVSAP